MKTAVRQLTFLIENENEGYIDIAECLSIVNRQAFRQGYVYLVESFTWQCNTPGSCTIISLPTSWTVYQSWKKSKRLWDKMNRLGASGIAYPAYHDYKVFMDAAHYQSRTGVNSNRLPVDGAKNLFSNVGREWRYSQFVHPKDDAAVAAPENACHMLGADDATNNASIGTEGSWAIIQAYGATRVTVGLEEPQLPGDASGNWQTDLFDAGETSEDIVNHLEYFNDQPPYAHALDATSGADNPIYVGGSESGVNGHLLARIFPIAAETVYAPGAEIPLGLLQVVGNEGGHLTINVAPGSYKGVAAMPMGKVST